MAKTRREPPHVPAERPGPRGGVRDKNRRMRLDALCRAALGLFLARGLSEVTIDEIVERAGIAKGSFYRYFEDKEDLVVTLFEPLTTVLRDAMNKCTSAASRAESADDLALPYLELASTFAKAVETHPDLMRLYLQESRAPASGARRPVRELSDEIAARALALGMEARKHDMFRDLDPHVVTLLIVGAAERLLYEQLTKKHLGDPSEVASALVSVVIEGLRAR